MPRFTLNDAARELTDSMLLGLDPHDASATALRQALVQLPRGRSRNAVGLGIDVIASGLFDSIYPVVLDVLRDLVSRLVAAGVSAAEKKVIEAFSPKSPSKSLDFGRLTVEDLQSIVESVVASAEERRLNSESSKAIGYLLYGRMLGRLQ